MSIKNLNVLFLLDRRRLNSKNKCPLRCRITYQGKKKLFSIGVFISPNDWNSTKQQILESSPDHEVLNKELTLVRQKMLESFLFLQVNAKNFDVEDVLLQYKGESIKANKTLLEVFELHNSRMEKLIGKSYAKSTYNKFLEAKMHIKNFLKHSYNRNDIPIESIKLKFLDDLDFYLKSELDHKQITINKTIQRLRKIIKLAVGEGYLERDPFILYVPKRCEKKLVYLTQEELSLLEAKTFSQSRLNKVKDLFVFCCYTGLAFAEMDSLEKKHLVTKFDGNLWIEMYRQKTSSYVSVPLLPKAKEIISKYENESDKVLPSITNQKFNSYIKEIAEILGIEKNITHHIARKTFATTVLLFNDVPMEVVSELLGHSKLAVTQQHYAKVVQKKISDELNRLSSRMR